MFLTRRGGEVEEGSCEGLGALAAWSSSSSPALSILSLGTGPAPWCWAISQAGNPNVLGLQDVGMPNPKD